MICGSRIVGRIRLYCLPYEWLRRIDGNMDKPSLTFHHFGLAVSSPDRAFRFLQAMGYSEGSQAYDPLQRVNAAMRHHSVMPDVEVIWPGEAPSPIDIMIRGGKALIYHLCYASDDAHQAVADLRQAGLDVIQISPPTPAVLFGYLDVSFYNVLGLGLVEIIHGHPASAALKDRQPGLP